MKSALKKCFLVLAFTLSVSALSTPAQAYFYTHCSDDAWYKGHRVCWVCHEYYYNRTPCGCIAGYWYHGYFYPFHRDCWY